MPTYSPIQQILEELGISTRDLNLWNANPYESPNPSIPSVSALAAVRRQAHNLQRVSFENFEYEIDGKRLDPYLDSPGLQELVAGEVEDSLEEDFEKCDAGGYACFWSKLELGRSM